MEIILNFNFKFEPVPLSDIELEIRLLNPKKAKAHKNIPLKILKSSSEATDNFLHRLFSETITKGVFLAMIINCYYHFFFFYHLSCL